MRAFLSGTSVGFAVLASIFGFSDAKLGVGFLGLSAALRLTLIDFRAMLSGEWL